MIRLKLEIGRIENKTPEGKIIFNDVIVHEGAYTKDNIELHPVIGRNSLNISLTNKKDRDTKLQGNRIIEDVYVKVVDIVCEVTKDSAGHLDTIGSYATSKGENLKTYGYLSYNGTYTFEFDYPFFVFQKNKIFYQ
jgi:hypothetical protein